MTLAVPSSLTFKLLFLIVLILSLTLYPKFHQANNPKMARIFITGWQI